jgi:hypothetical protein
LYLLKNNTGAGSLMTRFVRWLVALLEVLKIGVPQPARLTKGAAGYAYRIWLGIWRPDAISALLAAYSATLPAAGLGARGG